MLQGVNKEYIFNSDEYIEKFLDIFNKIKINYNFTVIAYCIMNNHAHFLIYSEDIKEVENLCTDAICYMQNYIIKKIIELVYCLEIDIKLNQYAIKNI